MQHNAAVIKLKLKGLRCEVLGTNNHRMEEHLTVTAFYIWYDTPITPFPPFWSAAYVYLYGM